MPENKRIANTGLIAEDIFMIEGTLSRINSKRPFQNRFDPQKYEFNLALEHDATHPINIYVPTSYSDADKARVTQGVQKYIAQGSRPNKTNPAIQELWLSKRASFTRQFNQQDAEDMMKALRPASTIPTFKENENGVYAEYQGTDPVKDSKPTVKVIISLRRYTRPTEGVTDAIRAVLFPVDMQAYGSGYTNPAELIKGFGLQVEQSETETETTADDIAEIADEAFQTTNFEQTAQSTTVEQAPANSPFNGNQASASPFGGNATQTTNSPFGAPQASPFDGGQTPPNSPFGAGNAPF